MFLEDFKKQEEMSKIKLMEQSKTPLTSAQTLQPTISRSNATLDNLINQMGSRSRGCKLIYL